MCVCVLGWVYSGWENPAAVRALRVCCPASPPSRPMDRSNSFTSQITSTLNSKYAAQISPTSTESRLFIWLTLSYLTYNIQSAVKKCMLNYKPAEQCIFFSFVWITDNALYCLPSRYLVWCAILQSWNRDRKKIGTFFTPHLFLNKWKKNCRIQAIEDVWQTRACSSFRWFGTLLLCL